MNIALAQIDMRLGDIEGACARIEDQARLAAQDGARLLCAPAPLMSGLMPGTLVDYPNFEHDLLRALHKTAVVVDQLGVICLIPAAATCEAGPYFEVFLLRGGQVAPFRLALFQARGEAPIDPWLPPVFDVEGMRVAVSFDFERDIDRLPPGCDLFIYFQVNPFNARDAASVPLAVADGAIREAVARAGVWMACMAPVGGFDDVVYAGGSFLMDDAGRVCAAAPCFEEALVVHDVRRDAPHAPIAASALPVFNEQDWLWSALRLHLADTLAAAGMARIMVPLEGTLPSALLAVLAVDAVGPCNVLGFFSDRPDALTPAEEAAERDRCARVRAVAERLHIRLIEHETADLSHLLDRPVARREVALLRGDIEAYYLVDAARVLGAFPVSPLCKTDYALAARVHAARVTAPLAPFGDLYLTDLEALARSRNRRSAAVPAELLSPRAMEAVMDGIVALAAGSCTADASYEQRMLNLLARLSPMDVDGALCAHIDRNQAFDEIPLSASAPEATGLLLMLVSRNEAARHRLPAFPIVSERSFVERSWPASLSWSDLGRGGAAALTLEAEAKAAIERFERSSEERGELVRDEVLDYVGGLVGLSPAQVEELQSEEGQRRIQEGMQRFGAQMREFFEQLMDGDGPLEDGRLGGRGHGPRPSVEGGEDRDGPARFSMN